MIKELNEDEQLGFIPERRYIDQISTLKHLDKEARSVCKRLCTGKKNRIVSTFNLNLRYSWQSSIISIHANGLACTKVREGGI